ncbi:8-oxoguanine glycosylase ogg1 [Elasticomyces elasticus]|uniref:DNA-(apurinic or apyrimidinic site) lyase n=1 Tax=Exophiala sideris TaxID=1016849 RepID=A0ABR0JAU6_9EURO|nr:8-oxoguanine glycosylase ogg1 [Elasticomyces elasticus]KAK5030513.1 8-oxoguanine glycosylase ogg1 [Exophiala sideris]KAK5038567.1 8-oxoguanine glycosylase ogg1 [Exophiala sideris]KAK5060448.1 8-oxoguanine glycosylase ogg1 [Exophiala sideris]KAK5183360.1 8-oxoguanine glycosylase ogg1 [Eurotiomycetes sp. CCFEE 6388]
MTEWRKLPISLNELCLATTLRCGQSFRWQQCEDQTWACTLRGRIVQLSQDQSHIKYRSIWPAAIPDVPLTPPSSIPPTVDEQDETDDTKSLIQHYLNLEPNLETLYAQWSGADPNFRKKAPKFTGVRILRQDAWEALVGFICSSNNNIIRISQMVDKLCTHYGGYIATLDGRPYHDFPEPAALTGKNVEAHLRDLGFGYRAKYIAQTAKMVAEDHEMGWLDSLQNPESQVYGQKASIVGDMKPEGRDGYREAHEQLLSLQGVGPKVADCVCLMGLGWGEAVPVDTHVWQIAQRDYKFGKGKHSSLTKTTYDAVANHFRKLWGKEAGWAHSVLFTADLRAFAERLTTKVETSIKEEVKDEEEAEVKIDRKETVQRVAVKREIEEIEPKSLVQAAEVTMSSGERVKRRKCA